MTTNEILEQLLTQNQELIDLMKTMNDHLEFITSRVESILMIGSVFLGAYLVYEIFKALWGRL